MTATLTRPTPAADPDAAPRAAATDEPRTLHLSTDDIEALGAEFDAIRSRVRADLGSRDLDHIMGILRLQRRLELGGRTLLLAGFFPPAWIAGVAALSASKILDNMEIGHNVMHGQYDWTGDPMLSSRTFEWDTACPADQWRHSHNVMHHTHTNILGMDRDIGYGLLRMEPEQAWNPLRLGNPLYAAALMFFFQWGVMLHDLEYDNVLKGRRRWRDVKALIKGWWRKAGRQVAKDYVVFPALTGPMFPITLAGTATANLVRNVWAFSVIFCGHFPTGAQVFTADECEGETRGEWYVRQLLGSANFDGPRWMHIASGHLSYQIEHHLYPDLPSSRYPEIADEVRGICERYGLPYTTGPLHRQIADVWASIVRLALPGARSTTGAPRVVLDRRRG